MAFVQCKDCIYGDCYGGKVRSCQQFPDIGTLHIVPDNFFCSEKGKSRIEWKQEYEKNEEGK